MKKKETFKAILYSRVSTTHDDQAESIDNQILLARNYLVKHPDIVLAEPLDKYSEKISGKTDIRPKYQEMCERLSQGDIHFLMIKDLKRLSRSVETTYAFLNLMKQYGFKIIQLSSGNIIDSKAFEEVEGNLLIGIEALFAQNMVLTQSRYGRTVQRVRCENKKLMHKDSTLFGYKWDPQTKDIVVDSEKAAVIKDLYDQYAFRGQSIGDLRKYLASMGYRYSAVTISKWLQDSKYIGDWTINRKGSVLGIGQGAKTRRFVRDKSEWVHVERPDLAIVEKDIYDLAQEIRLSRVVKYEVDGKEKSIGRYRFNGTHLFSGKIYCGECGNPYWFKWADRNQTIPIYVDSFGLHKRDDFIKCHNKHFRRIREGDLIEIIVAAINALNITGVVSINKMLESISIAIRSKGENNRGRRDEEKMLERLEKEAESVVHSFVDASVTMRKRLNQQLEELEEKIDNCRSRLVCMSLKNDDEEMAENRLLAIKEQLSGWCNITRESLNRSMVNNLVSRITVYETGKVEVSLALGLLKYYQLHDSSRKNEGERITSDTALPSKKDISKSTVQVLRDVKKGVSTKAINNIVSINHCFEPGKNMNIVVNLEIEK